MELITKAPRGTKDILPEEIARWQHVEKMILRVCDLFGFTEIRVPTFEHTELFERGVGETTDVVNKEMYTFLDKGERSITLRPEGTASVTRAVLESGLYGGALPVKLCYLLPCFRYEKPQAGRLREFHQFGVELFGASEPAADAEVILLASRIFDAFGLSNVKLKLNSIGCPECRKAYKAALTEYFAGRAEELCDSCGERLSKNPMRILDCKSPVCAEIAKGAPSILDYLCEDCAAHFTKVKELLTAAGAAFEVDDRIVRGLDYYSRTVFEFVVDGIGAQSTVCGGGRYDGLAGQLSDRELPGLGFAMGLERLLLTLEAAGYQFPAPAVCDLYLASAPGAENAVVALAEKLRGAGLSVQTDLCGRSIKAQMKYAGKIGARFSAVLGGDELESGKAELKRMEDGEKFAVTLAEESQFVTVIKENCNG